MLEQSGGFRIMGIMLQSFSQQGEPILRRVQKIWDYRILVMENGPRHLGPKPASMPIHEAAHPGLRRCSTHFTGDLGERFSRQPTNLVGLSQQPHRPRPEIGLKNFVVKVDMVEAGLVVGDQAIRLGPAVAPV
ncbi:MAG: hypothetical protein V9H25_21345 [Candidatus Competibacter sp.]